MRAASSNRSSAAASRMRSSSRRWIDFVSPERNCTTPSISSAYSSFDT